MQGREQERCANTEEMLLSMSQISALFGLEILESVWVDFSQQRAKSACGIARLLAIVDAEGEKRDSDGGDRGKESPILRLILQSTCSS